MKIMFIHKSMEKYLILSQVNFGIMGRSTLLLCVILAITGSQAFSQQFYTIKGIITDTKTKTVLPFAQISISHSTIGIASNTDGYFELNIPREHLTDSLLIYYLGYESWKSKISEMLNDQMVIRLKPVVLSLAEVEVVGLTPEEVIRRAVANIPGNYGPGPLILTAFIRVQKIINNKLVEFAEAVVNDKKDGYYLYKQKELAGKYKKSNQPELVKARVISDTVMVNSLDEVGKNAYCLSCYFSRDIVEFYPGTIFDEKEFKNYDFHMEELTGQVGKKIYHIRFDEKDKIRQSLWKGELFVDAESFAVEKVILKPSLKDYDFYNKKTKYMRTYTIRSMSGWIQEMPLGQTEVTYSVRNGRWCLNTIRNEYWMTYNHPGSVQMLKYGYKDEVVVTEVNSDPEKIRSFTGDKTIGKNKRWDQITGPPDEAFWLHYNYLPIEETLKNAIGKISDSR
jgi:hypothetical protein